MQYRSEALALISAIALFGCAVSDDAATPASQPAQTVIVDGDAVIDFDDVDDVDELDVAGSSLASESCDAVCGGAAVTACLPFGGWVPAALACGFAGVATCISACQDRSPIRIAEKRAKKCLLAELPHGSHAKRVGYNGTAILFRVKNARFGGGAPQSGGAAVKKTYAGDDKILASWNISGGHVRPLSETDCRATGPRAHASSVDDAPIYRYLNSTNLDHFYTLDRNDAGYAAFGYAFEGVEGSMRRTFDLNAEAVYRFWNPAIGDHFYTTDFEEGEAAAGYSYEGVTGYIYDGPLSGMTPLYRYWSATAGDHYYTRTYAPNGFCYGHCYSYEGILGWVN